MELEEHASKLAKRVRSRVGDTIVAYEVQRWPEGRLKQFVEIGLLRPLPDADEIRCPGCSKRCLVEPLKTTLPNGEPYAEYLCGKEGLVEIPAFLFQRWEVVKSKLIELGYLQEAEGGSKEQGWLDDTPEYIPNSEAVKLTDGKLLLPKLSKILKPDGLIRYMRQGHRCKVHIGDFREYVKNLGSDMFSEEAFEMHFSQADAIKETIRQSKERKGK